jgi:hypothetical protein
MDEWLTVLDHMSKSMERFVNRARRECSEPETHDEVVAVVGASI